VAFRIQSNLIWVMAKLAQQFRQTFGAPPLLFRHLLLLFGALAELRFAQERGTLHLSLLLGSRLRLLGVCRNPFAIHILPSQLQPLFAVMAPLPPRPRPAS
jgi:hypothetical protein